MPRAKPVEETSRGGKCKCNLGYMVVAWIIGAVGLWALVGGFATQFTSASPTTVSVNVLGWYFAGLLLVGLAKMAKWKAHNGCTVHKM